MKRLALRIAALSLVLVAGLGVGSRAQAPATPAPAPAMGPREQLRKLVFADRKAMPLKSQLISSTDVGVVKVERLKFTPEEGHEAVAVLYRPKAEGKYPVVIVQHFLGGSKDHIGLVPLMHLTAQKGFMVAAIDGRYRGERQNGTSLEAAMLEALKAGKGHPFLIDTAYDINRFIDLLSARPDVDPNRIGMTGLSEGGILTWMSALIDDRIKVAVPIIGVTCFGECFNAEGPDTAARIRLFEPFLTGYAKHLNKTELDGALLRSAWEKLVPGMLDGYDAPKAIPMIAPRPLLILVHEEDELFPVAGARKVHAAALARYKELKAEERIDFRVSPGKHAAFNFQEVGAMTEWMERWLKNAAN